MLLKNMSDDRKLSLIAQNTQFPVILKKTGKRRNRIPRFNEDNRVVGKSGRIHVYLYKVPEKSIRYVRDLWNTLVNSRWRWILLTVALVNVSAYLIFAGFFLLDAWVSGDFDPDLKDHKICIKGVHNFTSFFMLGIETITTTGYGYFHPTEYCKLVWIVLTFSTLITIFIDGAFISVVYVKISRPTYRISKGIFSKRAVITLRNGRLCLIFRINDKIGRHWINSQVKLFHVKDIVSSGGDFFPNFITELKLQPFGILLWPVEIVHEITPASPLWTVSGKDLLTVKFELVATVIGYSVLTGQSSISQTSYLSSEISWGYRFTPCLDFNQVKGEYLVNRKKFNKILAHDCPLCSASQLAQIEHDLGKKRHSVDYLPNNISSDQDEESSPTT